MKLKAEGAPIAFLHPSSFILHPFGFYRRVGPTDLQTARRVNLFKQHDTSALLPRSPPVVAQPAGLPAATPPNPRLMPALFSTRPL